MIKPKLRPNATVQHCLDCQKSKALLCPHCTICGAVGCEAHCYQKPNGQHEVQGDSIRPALTKPWVSFWCRHCGQSGEVQIDFAKAAWVTR